MGSAYAGLELGYRGGGQLPAVTAMHNVLTRPTSRPALVFGGFSSHGLGRVDSSRIKLKPVPQLAVALDELKNETPKLSAYL